ncbi:MAG TPA: hypothetical protein PKA06_06945, partial [Gemmatales bacterium]|nr:hypothetical protein [Gemmatales bacterium]
MIRILLGVLATSVTLQVVWNAQGTSAPTSSRTPFQLQVGFAEKDITPEVGPDKPPVYIAGFGQNRIADGIQDPLFARAVVLSDGTSKIALVSLDIVGFFYPHAMRVREALPGFAHVVVSSTHNHEGPDTMGLWGPNPFKNGIDPAYLKRVEEQSIAAVKEAEQKL